MTQFHPSPPTTFSSSVSDDLASHLRYPNPLQHSASSQHSQAVASQQPYCHECEQPVTRSVEHPDVVRTRLTAAQVGEVDLWPPLLRRRVSHTQNPRVLRVISRRQTRLAETVFVLPFARNLSGSSLSSMSDASDTDFAM